ncbi:fumarate/nitrate reduction transcriptional regulator Fnr [Permianibacter sp. IMCC34836]|uniref:fumarate/nitrate reduction transcriptional regulator Fnr n=1 Tax=Permianibacter fluminis TaxID=2738515 RepID=UPI0015576280|nr:fumarate/nitrate reduction transcriptional regulator Fnr [Permianibacter fluminis]NQD37904.1 fumarate/nitrate reduction transcriptional regulator Fnr [Permianibacter fluminis]
MRINEVASPMPKISCQQCSISQLCLPVSLAEAEVEHLDSIIKRNRPLQRGEHMFRAGDSFQSLYAIRSGSLKTYTVSPDGEEQITGFHLAGEVIGLDAVYKQSHPSFAMALETTMVCELPFEQLEELSGSIPGLRQQLLKVMSREILEDQELLLLLNKKNAEERLAAFLINLSTRYARRGRSAQRFLLPMTRGDIGNYLGLTIETVSRLFTRYQKAELIQAQGKEVSILDMKTMSEMAGINCTVHSD